LQAQKIGLSPAYSGKNIIFLFFFKKNAIKFPLGALTNRTDEKDFCSVADIRAKKNIK